MWSRGGAAGGYIRITRVRVDRQTLLMHVINSIGDTLDLPSARAIIQNLTESEAIDRAAGKALLSAVSDSALAHGAEGAPRPPAGKYLQTGFDPSGLTFHKGGKHYEV